eukprot:TRINITY_DN21981_c0_g1_i2.p1 TRINITY_DN21981_c0_g1~~TRINITY_DN21981_c0_g1_i2.p1  ORF type:complete len:434 (-),score=63.57 TRINITY_DN21981_c0_g1_i2:69-1370(-)
MGDVKDDAFHLAECQVDYAAWLEVYEKAKMSEECLAQGIDFCLANPATVNYRKHNAKGWTMLFQAVYWGAERKILEDFKNVGADPSLKDWKGRKPVDVAHEKGHNDTAQHIIDVWGDFEQDKRLILGAAKGANLPKVVDMLKTKPHLIRVQSDKGWGILHHLALQGVRPAVLRNLIQRGACPDIRTYQGETYLDVLEKEEYGGSPARRQAAETVMANSSYTTGGNILAGAGVSECVICDDKVYGEWILGKACVGEPHAMCAECTVNWAWSQFTSGSMPIKCQMCGQKCDLEGMPPSMSRAMCGVWADLQSQYGTSHTFDSFIEVLNEKNRELVDERAVIKNTIEILRSAPALDHPIAYVEVENTPSCRACPNCHVPCYHISDCKHVTCQVCETPFCWLCARTADECNDWSHAERCVPAFKTIAEQIDELRQLL